MDLSRACEQLARVFRPSRCVVTSWPGSVAERHESGGPHPVCAASLLDARCVWGNVLATGLQW